MQITLPVYRNTKEVSEDSIKNLTVEQCLQLRKEIQDTLIQLHQTNPGILARLLNCVNERIFEVSYGFGAELNEAYEE